LWLLDWLPRIHLWNIKRWKPVSATVVCWFICHLVYPHPIIGSERRSFMNS
jgi:hypothetical protein